MPKVVSSGPKPEMFAKGGNGHMFGQQHAGPMTPGQTSKPDSTKGGKFAEGGKGHMFGRQNANTMVPGQTAKN